MTQPFVCPICASTRHAYEFKVQGHPLQRCSDCGLMGLHPQPDDAALAAIYGPDYFLGAPTDQGREAVGRMKAATARRYLDDLLAYCGPGRGRLLELGCGRGEFLAEAQAAGFEVEGLELNPGAVEAANARLGGERVRQGTLESLPIPDEGQGRFDVCALFDVLEHARQPVELLAKLRRHLKPGGVLFIVTPDLDGFSARLMRQNWMEFKPEHLWYFGGQTLQSALAKAGFEQVVLRPNRKVLSLAYVNDHFQRYPSGFFSTLSRIAAACLPGFLLDRAWVLPASGINVLCRPAPAKARPLLSVIVPVYNEAATVRTLLDALLAKALDGLDKELIIVESNSSDGTRDIVMGCQGRDGVRVLLQDRPQGKGFAVREGLGVARGDFVMIQDGDLEYDLDDYDQLLEPLMRYQAPMVLGSRHGGDWKMRKFTDQPLAALLLNLAHVFFATLLNIACASRLRDPFTMFKLFRRDCLHGLRFKANRFDFDFELVIKLLRKGYRPLEIPVNYRSRSFKQGKKVRFIYDPLTWLWALVRFRVERL